MDRNHSIRPYYEITIRFSICAGRTWCHCPFFGLGSTQQCSGTIHGAKDKSRSAAYRASTIWAILLCQPTDLLMVTLVLFHWIDISPLIYIHIYISVNVHLLLVMSTNWHLILVQCCRVHSSIHPSHICNSILL